MSSTMPGRVRPLSIIAALILIVFSLGVGGSASADPGNGKGKGAEKSSASQNSQPASSGAANASTSSSSSTDNKQSNGKSAAASGKKKSEPSADKSSPAKAKSGKSGSHGTSGTAGTSGNVNDPQPISKADANKGGANGQCPGGPYCSTREGSPSMNGSGGGKASGRPCAGCVGKADNKNPKGQMPNGSDHNNGYECDGNNGIGKTNPAHTGCTTSNPPPCEPTPANNFCGNPPPCEAPGPPDCPTPRGCEAPGPPDCPNPPVDRPRPPVDLAGVETELLPAAAVVPPGVTAPAALPTAQPTALPAALPATGAPGGLGLFGLGGAGLVLAGGLTIWLQRRMKPTS